jgi:hypothetical protein
MKRYQKGRIDYEIGGAMKNQIPSSLSRKCVVKKADISALITYSVHQSEG